MKKTLKICISTFFLFSNMVYAIPNYWDDHVGNGGHNIYMITNERGNQFTIDCDEGSGEYNHVLYFDDQYLESNAEFLINGDVYSMGDLYTRMGKNDWSNLILNFKESNEFEIYINNELLGKFSPKNSKTKLKNLSCLFDEEVDSIQSVENNIEVNDLTVATAIVMAIEKCNNNGLNTYYHDGRKWIYAQPTVQMELLDFHIRERVLSLGFQGIKTNKETVIQELKVVGPKVLKLMNQQSIIKCGEL